MAPRCLKCGQNHRTQSCPPPLNKLQHRRTYGDNIQNSQSRNQTRVKSQPTRLPSITGLSLQTLALLRERTNTAESCSDDESAAEQRKKRKGVDTESVHNVMPSAGK
ncbi:hypothetical protein TNCV_338791 [Trichonephila clavipes]|nr:hypothetical protein TNCV_338791 [Trichonephila clavipes]